MRKLEDDFMWRRGHEQKNNETLIKNMDMLQLENIDLKRDVDSLRVLVEQKEDRVHGANLERRKLTMQLEDMITGRFCLFSLFLYLYKEIYLLFNC